MHETPSILGTRLLFMGNRLASHALPDAAYQSASRGMTSSVNPKLSRSDLAP